MSMKPLVGLERDRALISAAVRRVSQAIFDLPLRKRQKGDRTGLLAPPPLKVFRRLEPLGFGLVDEDDWWIFHPDDCTPDVVWPLDVGVILEHAGQSESQLAFTRTYSVTPQQVRGAVTRFSPFMVRHDNAVAMKAELWTASGISAWIGGDWINADAHQRYYDDLDIPSGGAIGDREDERSPRLATALALRQRYQWAVALGISDDAPSIRFATDPTGIKEFYRLRDLPDGGDRREALISWVEDHWRQERQDPEMETYVRKHLRGALKFRWRGLIGEILPSQYDLDKRDQLMAERQAMRIAGTDRRRRP
jgi:hypothetical protein